MEFIDLFNVLAATTQTANEVCKGLGPIFGLIGWIVLIIKIAVPIILIVIGMLNMAQAIIAKNDDKIEEAQKALIKKVIAAVIVFLVVTIVTVLFSTIMQQTDWENKTCVECIDHPTNDICKIPTSLKDATK